MKESKTTQPHLQNLLFFIIIFFKSMREREKEEGRGGEKKKEKEKGKRKRKGKKKKKKKKERKKIKESKVQTTNSGKFMSFLWVFMGESPSCRCFIQAKALAQG